MKKVLDFADEFIQLCIKYNANPEWKCNTNGLHIMVTMSAKMDDNFSIQQLQENLSPKKLIKQKKGKK